MACNKPMKRILLVSQYFWPENFRINELVHFLSKKKSLVLTSYPSYPQKKKFDKKIYLRKKFFSKNCEIKRVPVYLRNNTNLSIIKSVINSNKNRKILLVKRIQKIFSNKIKNKKITL